MKRPNSFAFGPLAFVTAAIAIVPASMARTGSDDNVAHTRRPDAVEGRGAPRPRKSQCSPT
jgi:hypothetical protein